MYIELDKQNDLKPTFLFNIQIIHGNYFLFLHFTAIGHNIIDSCLCFCTKKMWGFGLFRADDPDCCCYNSNPSIFNSLQCRDNACDGHTNICALGVCLYYHLFMYLIFTNVKYLIEQYISDYFSVCFVY